MKQNTARVCVAGVLVACGLYACGGAFSEEPPSSLPDAGTEDASPSDTAPRDATAEGDSATKPDATLDSSADAGPDADADADSALDGSDDAQADAAPAPFCSTGSTACLDRLDLGGFTLPYYRSHPLGTPNTAIQNIVLVVHGNARNADAYFATMAGLALAKDPVHTLVLAPHFQAVPADGVACAGAANTPAATDLYWSCGGWQAGNGATNASTTYSSAALDALVAAAKTAFPSVTRVTIVGYSAGAQTVQRSIAGSTEQDRTPAITTRYVVASPSSYLYLDDARLKPDAVCPDAASCALDATSFEKPWSGAAACATYDTYKYGLVARTGLLRSIAPNSANATLEESRKKLLRDRYLSRSVVYVVSTGDSNATLDPSGFAELDKDCEASAQGPVDPLDPRQTSYRLQRGLTYYYYVTQVHGAAHRLAVVPSCIHSQSCVLSDPIAQAEIFGP